MQNLIESAAIKFGVPIEVLDIIGRDYVSKLIEDLPNLLLPPFMTDLKQILENRGLRWISENVDSLRKNLLLLRQMYGPAESEEFWKPDYSSALS
jgi:hypothetical protein